MKRETLKVTLIFLRLWRLLQKERNDLIIRKKEKEKRETKYILYPTPLQKEHHHHFRKSLLFFFATTTPLVVVVLRFLKDHQSLYYMRDFVLL